MIFPFFVSAFWASSFVWYLSWFNKWGRISLNVHPVSFAVFVASYVPILLKLPFFQISHHPMFFLPEHDGHRLVWISKHRHPPFVQWFFCCSGRKMLNVPNWLLPIFEYRLRTLQSHNRSRC